MSTATASATTPAAGTWSIDASHSSVEAVARHLMVTKVRARLAIAEGTVVVADDIADSTVTVEIDAASIDTNDAKRDGHLKSGDFLDVENHPTIRFVSEGGVTVDGSDWKVPGQLTVRGVTQPVVLDVTYHGLHKDPWGGTRAAFSASTEIDREAFDVTWNQTLESGGVLVSKNVKIEIDLQLVQG